MASFAPNKLGEIVNQVQYEYTRQWSVAAEQHSSSGDYDWMASFLKGYERVLEIGTGNGTSTAHLVQQGHPVVSLDLNPSCIDAARTTLTQRGVEVAYHVRKLRREIVPPNGFQVVYGPIGSFVGKLH